MPKDTKTNTDDQIIDRAARGYVLLDESKLKAIPDGDFEILDLIGHTVLWESCNPNSPDLGQILGKAIKYAYWLGKSQK